VTKFFISIVLLLISYPCHSKWLKIREGKIFSEYIETDSAKKQNGIIYMWNMLDYSKPINNNILSKKYYSKYDCSEMKYKIISIIEYETNMGKGRDFKYKKNLSNGADEINWSFPLVNSEDYERLIFVCNSTKKTSFI
tara:strand:+ start:330 stop:743 length:414 start_codon:yes stop_codon:yes gene_type:complete